MSAILNIATCVSMRSVLVKNLRCNQWQNLSRVILMAKNGYFNDSTTNSCSSKTHARFIYLAQPWRKADVTAAPKAKEKIGEVDTPVLYSLIERGVYHEDQYKHTADKKILSSEISSDGKTVELTWNDGHKSRFHSIWLRHTCHCPQCRLDHNGQARVDFVQVDVDDTRLTSVDMEGDRIVLLKWQTNGGEGKHEGCIPTSYLRIYCYSAEALDKKSAERAMTFDPEKTVPQLDLEEISNSEEGLYKWLVALSTKGLCLLKNVPREDCYVKKVAEIIAPIQHTVYGEHFDVVSKSRPENAAYSSMKIIPHMDQTIYESPPGLQLLHCLKFDDTVVGGENTFVDVYEVAHKFREEHPEYFDVLATIPYTAETVNYRKDFSVHLQIQRPIFALNRRKEEDMELFYRAYIAFFRMVCQYPSYYQIRLTPGDLISFSNRRVAHSRNAFQSDQGERHLQGAYVEISEFQSQVQVYLNRYGDGRLARRSGSLDWS